MGPGAPPGGGTRLKFKKTTPCKVDWNLEALPVKPLLYRGKLGSIGKNRSFVLRNKCSLEANVGSSVCAGPWHVDRAVWAQTPQATAQVTVFCSAARG